MKKRMVVMIIALVVVFGGLIAWNMVRSMMIKKYFATFQTPPVTLSAARAEEVTWFPELPAIGQLQAINGVNVTAQNAGQIVKIFFNSGDFVKAGQPLVQQDLRVEQETLKNYQASLQFNEVMYNRDLNLAKRGFVAKSDLDQILSQYQQAKANVAKTQVTIDQMTIKAPFEGKLGIRQANLGQYLSPGDTIVPLQQLNPLRVIFTLPEQSFSQLYVKQPVQLSTDAYPNQIFMGNITALNSEVNEDTRNIQVEAIINNPGLKLYPGMFANVNVILPQKKNVIVVPQTAVNYDLYGDSVYVLAPAPVKSSNKKSAPTVYIPKKVYVQLGDRRGAKVVITDGLKGNDLLVTSGQLKITDKTTIIINNSVDITTQQSVDTPY